ncbi:MAG TPA: helix-turn-helix domain-containing protein [Terracidiphilus sp.]
MKKTPETKNRSPYSAHRERQRRRILDAARAVFDERGIDRVTMAELTAASGVQPSTMYQYFSNKEDIVWALLGGVMEESAARAKRIAAGAPNAYAEIASLFESLADELTHSPATIRFMAQFDAMYARDWPAKQLLALESRIAPGGFRALNKLIRKGMADGSLRGDLNPSLTMQAVLNAVIGAQRRLASLGTKVEQEYGQPVDRLFRETIRVILMGLRAPESAPAGKAQTQPRARRTAQKRSTR